MNSIRDPDAIIAAWLEDGPTELAEPMRHSITTAARATPQRRRVGAPWRSLDIRGTFKLAVGAVAVIAVAAVGAFLLGRTANVGNQPSPALGDRGSALMFERPFDYVIPAGSGMQLVTESAGAYLFEVGGEAGDEQGVNVRVSGWGLINPCSPSDGRTQLHPDPQVIVEYLRSVRGLEVSNVTEIVLDGRRALSVDVAAHPESGCTAITLWPDMPPFTDQLPPRQFATTRMIATEVDGANVVVVIWAEDLAAWLPTATSFVDSLHFR